MKGSPLSPFGYFVAATFTIAAIVLVGMLNGCAVLWNCGWFCNPFVR